MTEVRAGIGTHFLAAVSDSTVDDINNYLQKIAKK